MAAYKKEKTCHEIDAVYNDIEFMKSMMSGRKDSYSRIKKVVTKHIQLREERNKKKSSTLMLQHDIEEHRMDFTSSSSESEDNKAQEEEMDFQKRIHKRMVKSGVTIFIPHYILKSKEMVSCSMRNNNSSTQLSAIVHTVSMT